MEALIALALVVAMALIGGRSSRRDDDGSWRPPIQDPPIDGTTTRDVRDTAASWLEAKWKSHGGVSLGGYSA